MDQKSRSRRTGEAELALRLIAGIGRGGGTDAGLCRGAGGDGRGGLAPEMLRRLTRFSAEDFPNVALGVFLFVGLTSEHVLGRFGPRRMG